MTANLSILFVDDEPNVLQGIRRATRRQRDRWDMHFVESGAEALQLLSETDIDVVVSDIRMPGMDGTELLQKVKVAKPSVVRIILSGYAEEEAMLRSTRVAHRFLHKPCELEELQQTIDEIVQTRQAVDSQAIMELVGRIDQLPTLGEVYLDLAAAIERDNWTPEGLARIVSQDVGLTVELLRLVNSAFFGLRRRIESVEQAIGYLGVDVIRGVVAGHSLLATSDGNLVDVDRVATTSKTVAIFSRSWVRHSGGTNHEAAEAFLGGMVHEVGTLALAGLGDVEGDDLQSILASNDLTTDRLHLGGVDRFLVGSYLLGLWGFPEMTVDAVRTLSEPAVGGVEPLAAGLRMARRGIELGVLDSNDLECEEDEIDGVLERVASAAQGAGV